VCFTKAAILLQEVPGVYPAFNFTKPFMPVKIACWLWRSSCRRRYDPFEITVQQFTDKFEEVVSATIPPELLIPEIIIDAEIDFKDM